MEGSDAAAVKATGERLLSTEVLITMGAKPAEIRGMYQMEYSIQNLAT